MDNERRNQLSGLLGTLLLHVAIFLFLWLLFVKASNPQEESGVPVLLGSELLAQGDGDKYEMTKVDIESVPEPVAAAPDNSPADVGEEIVTQDVEETVVVEQKKSESKKEESLKQPAKEEVVEKPKTKTEAEKRAEAEAAAAQAAAKNVAGAFGKGASMENRGEAEKGQGIQGSPQGNGETGKPEGLGGYGDFDLDGRNLGDGALPRPDYVAQDEGRVVVAITVNPAGQVIHASIHKRTNTTNSLLRRAAIEAARKARFNAVDGVNNQSGTITYYFKLK